MIATTEEQVEGFIRRRDLMGFGGWDGPWLD